MLATRKLRREREAENGPKMPQNGFHQKRVTVPRVSFSCFTGPQKNGFWRPLYDWVSRLQPTRFFGPKMTFFPFFCHFYPKKWPLCNKETSSWKGGRKWPKNAPKRVSPKTRNRSTSKFLVFHGAPKKRFLATTLRLSFSVAADAFFTLILQKTRPLQQQNLLVNRNSENGLFVSKWSLYIGDVSSRNVCLFTLKWPLQQQILLASREAQNGLFVEKYILCNNTPSSENGYPKRAISWHSGTLCNKHSSV